MSPWSKERKVTARNFLIEAVDPLQVFNIVTKGINWKCSLFPEMGQTPMKVGVTGQFENLSSEVLEDCSEIY